ncbi:hypothetical protein DSO57_1029983 [Entomophthora muscae]|uniref:Uncharacterized protein n=1 Tax=Entomophthora muscae TaxID=34485 RepID=A0ACC2UA19_9FUNG|nr:hypothetical protein DSO57_1029983 [Entomophthora muscae]
MLKTRILFNNLPIKASVLRVKPDWQRIKDGEPLDSKVIEKFRRRLKFDEGNVDNPRNRAIKYSSHILCYGIGFYMAIIHDYGYEDHCFAPLRGWLFQKWDNLWNLSESEIRELKDDLES